MHLFSILCVSDVGPLISELGSLRIQLGRLECMTIAWIDKFHNGITSHHGIQVAYFLVALKDAVTMQGY